MSESQSLSLKNDQECPICGSKAIHSGAAVEDKEGLRGANRIPVDARQYVALDNYVCLSCGYVESYIADRGLLNRIERHWPRVIPADDELSDAESP